MPLLAKRAALVGGSRSECERVDVDGAGIALRGDDGLEKLPIFAYSGIGDFTGSGLGLELIADARDEKLTCELAGSRGAEDIVPRDANVKEIFADECFKDGSAIAAVAKRCLGLKLFPPWAIGRGIEFRLGVQ